MQLHIRSWGSGERWALLIHGVSADSLGWAEFAEHFVGRGWRVVAPDLRGHGESPRGHYSLAELAADVVESVPAGPDLALGHSLGGALLTLSRDRLLPRAAVYADPAWKIDISPEQVAAGREALTSFTREQWRAFNPRWSEQAIDVMLEGIQRWDMDAFAADLQGEQPDLRPVSKPAVPSLLLLSSGVEVTEPRGYDVIRLAGVSHTMFWDDPELCARNVLDWLATVEPA